MPYIAPLSPSCPPELSLLDRTRAETASTLLRAVADPVRLRLLHHIATFPGTTLCACHLPQALGISQPTLSHHVGVLVGAGLVNREMRGRWAHYTVDPATDSRLFDALDEVLAKKDA
jgi:ArsR family transcriptional regulator